MHFRLLCDAPQDATEVFLERISHHSAYFDNLVDLFPARVYFTAEDTGDEGNVRKETKQPGRTPSLPSASSLLCLIVQRVSPSAPCSPQRFRQKAGERAKAKLTAKENSKKAKRLKVRGPPRFDSPATAPETQVAFAALRTLPAAAGLARGSAQ